MQVLKDEFKKISSNYGHRELYLEGFTPEQIYYQMEDLCNAILQRSEKLISELHPKYEKLPSRKERKICSEKSLMDVESEAIPNQDEISSGSVHAEEMGVAEESDGEDDESLESRDFDISENEIFQMPASDAIKLLESRVRRSEEYSSDGSGSDSEAKNQEQ
ncbi:hypothetical protein M970_010130 [Encephalitozoon cuniculi EcunIII-L]|uniref:Uncharacterized protein n=1 Tax=Encephalitozoon cuniculi TaxID=6035 RepID=M1JKR2_ENCCN|nr:hypothetical protein ECU01_0320 [Encephalitozoon cuniculi]KMV66685.1 hypothetical protein M970_010130 [Encephalitozoon cuniculi EcunIII-L]UYI28399.1 hypothetical protein J0A71_11g23100 [Encephalitozoon cuniculi]